MSDQHQAKDGRGPHGTSTNTQVIDKGTLAKTQHRPPGPRPYRPPHSPPSSWQIALKKTEYLAYARSVSYVMQGKSAGEGALVEIKQELGIGGHGSKPSRIQTVLGGAFLRMYLDGKVEPSTTAEAGE